MNRLKKLCNAVRAISQSGTISITGIENTEQFEGKVYVGDVILFSSIGTIEEVIEEMISKLEKISQRILIKLETEVRDTEIDIKNDSYFQQDYKEDGFFGGGRYKFIFKEKEDN